jgi:retron-type reverse transcriptase
MNYRKNKKFADNYDSIISIENLLDAWKSFQRGKKRKKDVQMFEYHLMDNILNLHIDLKNKTYTHGGYKAFKVNDPKPRDIHKATVRDRVIHHVLYQALTPFYFPLFISDSYSCQDEKGTHKALKRFQKFGDKVSKNHTKQCYVLKCDIKKFFASIDQTILMTVLKERIIDQDILWLLTRVIESFSSTGEGKGLPLGNLTSQLLVNIYMHEFDRYMKQVLKVKYYIRYADDFVIFGEDEEYLVKILKSIKAFLKEKLQLELHPYKVSIETLGSGVDFLGWVHFLKHRVLRTATKRRMMRNLQKKIGSEGYAAARGSYLGMLSHGNAYGLQMKVEKLDSEY